MCTPRHRTVELQASESGSKSGEHDIGRGIHPLRRDEQRGRVYRCCSHTESDAVTTSMVPLSRKSALGAHRFRNPIGHLTRGVLIGRLDHDTNDLLGS